MTVRIELLYERDCSSLEVALARLREVAREEGHDGTIDVIEVATDEDAVTRRFAGSPTILIDGSDIDPPAGDQAPYRSTCRAYRLPDGRVTPFPPKELIRSALRAAMREGGDG